jgi:hypothetical protein
LINVRYWRVTGILLIGVVKPDNNENGMISRKENSMACCMVAATDDSRSSMHRSERKRKERDELSYRQGERETQAMQSEART